MDLNPSFDTLARTASDTLDALAAGTLDDAAEDAAVLDLAPRSPADSARGRMSANDPAEPEPMLEFLFRHAAGITAGGISRHDPLPVSATPGPASTRGKLPAAARRPRPEQDLLTAAARSVHRCEHEITRAHGHGHAIYCHWLPRGHAGPCEPIPASARLTEAWFTAAVDAINDQLLLDEACNELAAVIG